MIDYQLYITRQELHPILSHRAEYNGYFIASNRPLDCAGYTLGRLDNGLNANIEMLNGKIIVNKTVFGGLGIRGDSIVTQGYDEELDPLITQIVLDTRTGKVETTKYQLRTSLGCDNYTIYKSVIDILTENIQYIKDNWGVDHITHDYDVNTVALMALGMDGMATNDSIKLTSDFGDIFTGSTAYDLYGFVSREPNHEHNIHDAYYHEPSQTYDGLGNVRLQFDGDILLVSPYCDIRIYELILNLSHDAQYRNAVLNRIKKHIVFRTKYPYYSSKRTGHVTHEIDAGRFHHEYKLENNKYVLGTK